MQYLKQCSQIRARAQKPRIQEGILVWRLKKSLAKVACTKDITEIVELVIPGFHLAGLIVNSDLVTHLLTDGSEVMKELPMGRPP